MLRPPPQQTVWQHPQPPQHRRTVRQHPQHPRTVRQPRQHPQTVLQHPQLKSLKYENYVIENINNININLQKSVLIFNKENELLLDIENIKYIEDIKHTIKNLRENSLNNLSFVNSLDNFSVSIYTQNKIITLQENLHFFS